jgi:hypothetical protein
MTIYRAMNKYGHDKFNIYPVDFVKCVSKEQLKKQLDELEILFIRKFLTMDKNIGYNMTAGGGGCLGRIMTEESKNKISAANSGINNGMFGTTWSEDKRTAMKEQMSGARNHNYGKPCSELTKKKLSDKLSGRIISEETRQKISASSTGKKMTPETRVNMSVAQQNRSPMSDTTKQKLKDSRKFGSENQLSKQVIQLSMAGDFIKIHESMSDAARECNTYHSSISNCCRGIKQSSGGFKWAYNIKSLATHAPTNGDSPDFQRLYKFKKFNDK